MNAFITAPTRDEVQAAFMNLADEWPCIESNLPVRCADGHWAIMARVWKIEDEV